MKLHACAGGSCVIGRSLPAIQDDDCEDILGADGNMVSHVHFEALDSVGKVIENLHLGVTS